MDKDYLELMYAIGDKRQEKIIQLYRDLDSRSLSEKFDAGEWIDELRQSTPANYLEPYLDALRKARALEQ